MTPRRVLLSNFTWVWVWITADEGWGMRRGAPAIHPFVRSFVSSSPSFGLFPFTGCHLIPHPSCTNICLPLTLPGNPCIQISRRAKIPPLSVPGKINVRARARIILTGFRGDTLPGLRAENNCCNSNDDNLQRDSARYRTNSLSTTSLRAITLTRKFVGCFWKFCILTCECWRGECTLERETGISNYQTPISLNH